MEKRMYTESIRGYPYMPKQQLADEFHISKGTVYNRTKEIEEEIRRGRYSEYAVISDGKIVLVNVLVFIDYLKYRRRLADKNLRKYVPAFRPDELIKSIGWNNRIVVVDDGIGGQAS